MPAVAFTESEIIESVKLSHSFLQGNCSKSASVESRKLAQLKNKILAKSKKSDQMRVVLLTVCCNILPSVKQICENSAHVITGEPSDESKNMLLIEIPRTCRDEFLAFHPDMVDQG